MCSAERAELYKEAVKKIGAVNFITASGTVPCRSMIPAVIKGMSTREDIETNVLILPETPALLSVGKRVNDDKVSFVWVSGKSPCFILENGTIVPLHEERNCPIMRKKSWEGSN